MEKKEENIVFSLSFDNHTEVLLTIGKEINGDEVGGELYKLPPMTITSSLIETFFPFIETTTQPSSLEASHKTEKQVQATYGINLFKALLDARVKVQTFNGNPPHTLLVEAIELIQNFDPTSKTENNIAIGKIISSFTEENRLIDEIKLLRHAVKNWLDACNYPTKDTIEKDPHGIDTRAADVLQYRIMQAPPIPRFFVGSHSCYHKSYDFLPLAWAEIWHAMEKKIRARCCPYCGKVFVLPPNNTRKATCLAPACKQKYEIDRHGGLKAYREWERTRKILRSSDRPPGRPKLNKTVVKPEKKKAGRPRKDDD